MRCTKQEFLEFLVEAKKSTYSSGKPPGHERGGSCVFSFEYGDLEYVDRFVGSRIFSGQEVVREDLFYPIWSMNYFGRELCEDISPRELVGFLKLCLSKVPKEKPFRGPTSFAKGDWKYVNKVEGNVEYFEGYEAIFYQGLLVYELVYNGGILK